MTGARDPSLAEFVWIWNRLQGLQTPKLHLKICRWLEDCWHGDKRALLLMAFRNSGKSTLVGLFCAWRLAQAPDTRILILAADLGLARKMTRNVKKIIERHPACLGLKPKRADQWASDQFTINRPGNLRDPSMSAKGVTGNITGSRADIVICDDVEVPKTCDSAPKRADLRQRLSEIDYVLVPGGLQLYVGTPHSYYSIYADETRIETGESKPFLDGFTCLKLPLLDKQGRSRWPERFPVEEVAAIRKRTGKAKFESQMMLRPIAAEDCRLDPDQLRLYEGELDYREGNGKASLFLNGRRLVSASCWWDPAYGAPGSGDSSVVACLFTDETGHYWLHRVAYLTHDPARRGETDEATQLCRQVAKFARDYYLPAVTVETNGLGRFLPGLLRREVKEARLSCAVVETASRRSKDSRILEALDAPLSAGAIHAHRQIWGTPFIAEMREWRPGNNCRDDGLDAVSGCLSSEPVRLRATPGGPAAPRPNWPGGGGPMNAESEFMP